MRTELKYAKAFDDYVAAQPPSSRTLLLEMTGIIMEAVPTAQKTMNYGVPALRLVSGGKRDQQVMFAVFKKHMGLYPHPTTIEHFDEQLRPYKTSKGAIQFPLDRPLPRELIIEMVRYRRTLIEKGS